MFGFPGLENFTSTLNRGGLEEMAEPMCQALAELIHGCSPDPATQTAATTALVLGLWQLAGRKITPQLPSLILVNAGELEADPINAFMAGLMTQGDAGPQVCRDGPYMHGSIENAPKAMVADLKDRQEISGELPWHQEQVTGLANHYFAAQKTGYGSGRSRPYSQAWHEAFGLLTGHNDELILRLAEEADRDAFRSDIRDHPEKLMFPEGVGRSLTAVPKTLSVSGSLASASCDRELAYGVVALGLPFFLLPHTAGEPLAIGNRQVLDYLATTWPHNPVSRVQASLKLPSSPWVAIYQSALRKRLRNLPADYEFAVLQAVHQLGGVCDRIARFASTGSGVKLEEVVALMRDLYHHTLRGIVISVAGLAWHGLGLDLGASFPRAKMFKVLRALRKKGQISCEILMKNHHLKRVELDSILARLMAEDLVRMDKNTVTATSHSEFVCGLYARKDFPPVDNHWAMATGEDKG